MIKRYEWINGETYCDSDQMYDNETGNKTQPVYVADLLNEQDQKIKELEHRLANCIELPQGIDVGKTVYYVNEYCNEEGDELYEIDVGLVHWIEKELRVSNVEFNDNGNLKETYDGFNYTIYVRYESGLTFQHSFEDVGVWLFATEEEAKSKLEELNK